MDPLLLSGEVEAGAKQVLPPVFLPEAPLPGLLGLLPLGWAGGVGCPVGIPQPTLGVELGWGNEGVFPSSSLKATVPNTFLSLWVGKV